MAFPSTTMVILTWATVATPSSCPMKSGFNSTTRREVITTWLKLAARFLRLSQVRDCIFLVSALALGLHLALEEYCMLLDTQPKKVNEGEILLSLFFSNFSVLFFFNRGWWQIDRRHYCWTCAPGPIRNLHLRRSYYYWCMELY